MFTVVNRSDGYCFACNVVFVVTVGGNFYILWISCNVCENRDAFKVVITKEKKNSIYIILFYFMNN